MADQNQYDFILNPNNGKSKKDLFAFLKTGNKLVLTIFVGVILIIVFGLLALILNSGPSNTEKLLSVAQQQQELIRVADRGTKDARGTRALNLATTVKLNLSSDQTPLVAALKAEGMKVNSAELNAGRDASTDQKLTNALQNNRFDEVFVEHIQAELLDYQAALNEAYKTTRNQKLKETLKTQYDNATILITTEVKE